MKWEFWYDEPGALALLPASTTSVVSESAEAHDAPPDQNDPVDHPAFSGGEDDRRNDSSGHLAEPASTEAPPLVEEPNAQAVPAEAVHADAHSQDDSVHAVENAVMSREAPLALEPQADYSESTSAPDENKEIPPLVGEPDAQTVHAEAIHADPHSQDDSVHMVENAVTSSEVLSAAELQAEHSGATSAPDENANIPPLVEELDAQTVPAEAIHADPHSQDDSVHMVENAVTSSEALLADELPADHSVALSASDETTANAGSEVAVEADAAAAPSNSPPFLSAARLAARTAAEKASVESAQQGAFSKYFRSPSDEGASNHRLKKSAVQLGGGRSAVRRLCGNSKIFFQRPVGRTTGARGRTWI
ncbi:MAG: hypothetical protein WDM89_01295 [Rhizomicrobium sp.]